MLLQKECNINQEKIKEYKKLLDEVDFIDKKLSYIEDKDKIYSFLCLCIIPSFTIVAALVIFSFNLLSALVVGKIYVGLALLLFSVAIVDARIQKKFFINKKLNHSRKMNRLERKFIFLTNKREKKHKELLEQKENLSLKIKNLEIDFKRLELLFEEQKSKLDISSNESVKYVNAYNSYKNNFKNGNIIEALRSFTNYFEDKDLSAKNLYSYI